MIIKIPKFIIHLIMLAIVVAGIYFTGSGMLWAVLHDDCGWGKWQNHYECKNCETEAYYYERMCPQCGVSGTYQWHRLKRTSSTKPWYLSWFDYGVIEFKPVVKMERTEAEDDEN